MTSLGWEDDGTREGLMLRRSVEKCLTEAEIEDYLANRLSGVTREVIEEHLLVCSSCLDCVEQEEEFAEAFRTAALREEAVELERAYGNPPADAAAPGMPAADLEEPTAPRSPRGFARIVAVFRRVWPGRTGLMVAWVLIGLCAARF